eukprot:FR741175.1.p1 GENE.FR741175.1~~FR741175.1.p1  ORF type:complete len:317 (+),score=29.38 FR741175.1:23-952(+)
MAEHPDPSHGRLASTGLFRVVLEVKQLKGPFLVPVLEVLMFIVLGACFGLYTWDHIQYKSSTLLRLLGCAIPCGMLTCRECVQMYFARQLELKKVDWNYSLGETPVEFEHLGKLDQAWRIFALLVTSLAFGSIVLVVGLPFLTCREFVLYLARQHGLDKEVSTLGTFGQACRSFVLRVIALILGSIALVVGLPLWVASLCALILGVLFSMSFPGLVFSLPDGPLPKLEDFFNKNIHSLIRHEGFEQRGNFDKMLRYFTYLVIALIFGSITLVAGLSGLALLICFGVTALCLLPPAILLTVLTGWRARES